MRLIFIRHGDPDYEHDSLTEKGKKEALLLANRIKNWKDISEIYCSPFGRAIATAEPTLEQLNRKAITCDWLKEFYYRTVLPKNYPDIDACGKEHICWDLLPEFYFSQKNFFNKDKWYKTKIMKMAQMDKHYKEVCEGLDSLLYNFGYIRNKKGFYDVMNPLENPNWADRIEKYHLKSVKDDYHKEETLVFFCHLGVMFVIIAYLTGLSPLQLWQGFYVAPSSITILNSEERKKGQAVFRVERLGDTNHLTCGGEKISSSGYFAEVFRESN